MTTGTQLVAAGSGIAALFQTWGNMLPHDVIDKIAKAFFEHIKNSKVSNDQMTNTFWRWVQNQTHNPVMDVIRHHFPNAWWVVPLAGGTIYGVHSFLNRKK